MRAKKAIYPLVYSDELSEDGKRIRKRLPKVSTKRQELKARKEYYLRKIKINKNTKFNTYCEFWLERKIFDKDSTKTQYEMVIKRWIKPFFGDMKIGSIKRYDIEKYIKTLPEEHHLKTSYAGFILTIIKILFVYAWKNDIIQTLPTKAIKGFPYKKKDIRIPDYDECLRIADILKNSEKYKFPLLFGWYAGMRRGEALGVRWEDINLKDNIININQQILIEAGRIVCRPPKRNEIRTVPIAAALKAELVKVPIEERRGLVYKNIRSDSPKALDYYFKKHIKPLINIKCFHEFRHINLSKLLSLPNIPVDMIKNIAGHSSINTTTQIYGHKTSEGINQIKEALDSKLG